MNIYDLTFEELEKYFLDIGEKKFRASQVFEWLYKKRVTSFLEMTNLSKDLIDRLSTSFTLDRPIVVKE